MARFMGAPVLGCIDNPGGDKATASEAGNQGLGTPMAEGCRGFEALALLAPAALAHHLGVGACLINEDQPTLLLAHDGQAAFGPFGPRLDDVRPGLFRCQKAFFYS